MEAPDFEKEKIERLRRAMYSREMSEKLKPRDRRELGQTEPLVGEEWRKEEDSLDPVSVAPRFIGATRTLLKWVLVLSVVFFVAAIGFFAYYFAFGGGSVPAAPSNIDISVTGPPTIAGGEPVELQIAVVNHNKVPLQLADLVVTYPKGTRSPADFATDLPTQRISLGTIEAGGKRQGTVSAAFAGSEGSSANVKVELEYRVGGSSAVFVATSNYNVVFSSSPISISIDGNTQTISGQPVQLTVNVVSNANAPLRDVILNIDYPFGFKQSSVAPLPKSGTMWELGDFAPGERKSISIGGTMSGEQGDSRVFRFTAGTRKSPDSTQIDTKLADNTFAMNISQTFLNLAVSIKTQSAASDSSNASGASDISTPTNKDTVIAKPGDTVTVSIAYQNNLSTVIKDAVVVARLSGINIDGTTVHSADGFYRSTDNTVLWDTSTTNGALGILSAGEKGTLSFSFQIPSNDALKNNLNPKIAISINASGKRISETDVPQTLQSSVTKNIELATDLQVIAQGLYYANPFSSTGPIPPKAGTETTYAIVFNVINTTNKITNAKLTGHLPPYVRWVGIYSPSSEKLTFNQIDGSVTWDIGNIEPGVGIGSTPARQAAIAIGFTPSTSQIGEQPVLLQSVTLTGIDASTGGQITRTTTPDVSTNLAQISKSSTASLTGTDPGFSPTGATVVK